MVRSYISVVSTNSFIQHPPLQLSLLGQLRKWLPAAPPQRYARRWRGGHTVCYLAQDVQLQLAYDRSRSARSPCRSLLITSRSI